ncbi:NUDIX hydrolase [Novosphingobium bradum]|uniref:NUDIX hydrolase n=1 Tax=Novosphingobium bradum TaxID=1737444 RepID=A0ABV7IT90_9SPHN
MTTDQPPPEGAATPPTPAATLVVFRRAPAGGPPELLMIERAAHMRFAARATVFPGGRVDPADHALAARLAPAGAPLPAEETANRIAAIRETLEETGLLVGVNQAVTARAAAEARAVLLDSGKLGTVLERFGWALALDRLVPFARWCPNRERAFDTRFYLTDLGTGAVDLAVDGTENSRLFWSSAADTLASADRGGPQVIFPTRRNLERLALFAEFSEAADHAAAHPVTTISPWIEERDGERHLTIPEGRGYPVTSQPLATAMRG